MNAPASPVFIGCRRVATDGLPICCTIRTFALSMEDDSMRGRCILQGVVVVLEHGVAPRAGGVVAAPVDSESLVRTCTLRHDKPMLEAAHQALAALIPAEELVIQGVMISLIRHRKG